MPLAAITRRRGLFGLGAMAFEDDVAAFKADLGQLSLDQVFDRYIGADRCAAPVDFDTQALRERIAERFRVDVANVLIVGSTKLGFTLVDKDMGAKTPRPAFSPFSYSSDVDVAIIAPELFDHIWKLCFQFWHTSGYRSALTMWNSGHSFREYIFRGWMRPDKLPSEADVSYTRLWFEFFRSLMSERAAGDHIIRAGLYRDEYFLRHYQSVAVERRQALMAGAQ